MNTVLLLLVLFRFLLSVLDFLLLITFVQLPENGGFWWFFFNTTIQEKKNAVKPMKFFAIISIILVLHLAHCVKICSGLLPPSQNARRYCRKIKITSSV